MGIFDGIMNSLSGGQREAASASYQSSVDALSGLVPVSAAQASIALQRAVSLGQITPAQAQAQLQQITEMNGVTVSPELAKAQFDALAGLQAISDEGGLTSIDRAKLNAIATDEQVRERGQREAILNNASARGVSGSGLELASQLSNEQESANRASARGTEVAALAQQRALQALKDSGALASNMRDQSVSEQTAKAKAQDAINAFNANMRQQSNLANTNSANTAQQYNIDNAYNIQKLNMEQQRAEETNAANQINNQAQRDLELAKARANSLTNMGAYQNNLGNANTSASTGALSNIASNFGTYVDAGKKAWDVGKSIFDTVGGWISDEDRKTNEKELSEDDISKLLDNITGYSYTYKGTGTPGVGVMAQDLEKTPLKDSVVDTPNGKMVMSTPAMNNAMLAALANINKRLSDVEGVKA